MALTGAMIYLTVETFDADILGSFVDSGNIIVALLGLFVDSVAKFFCIIFAAAAFFGVCAFTALSILRFIFIKNVNPKAFAGVCIASIVVDGFVIFTFLSALNGIIYTFAHGEFLSGFAIACIVIAIFTFIFTAVNFALSITFLAKRSGNKSNENIK